MPESTALTTKGLIVAAVSFDEQTDAVIKSATSMARKFNMELRLIHVVEPIEYETITLDYSAAMYSVPPLLMPTTEELVAESKKQLEALLGKLDKSLVVSGVVRSGPAVETIAAEAVTRRANLIITACDPDAYNALSQGFSTALGLMHTAALPVLAVSKNATLDVNKAGLHLLIADDLQPSTQEAVRRAYAFATRLESPRIRHTHVHGDIREVLRGTWDDVRAKAATKASGKEAQHEAALAEQFDARLKRLRAQGQPFLDLAEKQGAKIELDVRTGNVQQQLHQAIEDFRPDLVIFGRHRLFRARPFLIGRMPFRAMLHEQRPVLLVPSTAELYDRLPFPAA